MATRQFIMNAGRTTKQGRQINVGKDDAEYEEMVTTLIMHPDDIEDIGASVGASVRVRSENGEGTFVCQEHGGKEGKVPPGMVFIAYGPPTCKLMGQSTDGTGMPTSKGWEVEIEPLATEEAPIEAEAES